MGLATPSAKGALSKSDPVMARVIATIEPPRAYTEHDPYIALIESITSQQLSVKAAATIYGRLCALFPGKRPVARRLAEMDLATLRSVGLSRQKSDYVRNVARFAMDGGLKRSLLDSMSDDEVITHLTQIKGVGRWTVEMLLMFCLERPDVFSADDLGIQNAMKSLYKLESKGPALRRRMARIATPWSPHRTLACMYLWKWLGQQKRT